ncbi:MAG: Uma2 family endonuclease [Acidobacteria bacterium]|nr:Uma2 family endonuclease [Acidobacteriota bacterium]
MTTTPTLLTEDDLLRMPDDGNRYELVEGELRTMAPTGYEHGRCTGKLHGLLINHVTKHRLGDVLAAETGFVIARAADGRVTVRAPAVAFVARGRVPADADTSRFLELAPDLVAETLSPSDTAVEVEEKIAAWLKAGVRAALVVNPASRTVTAHRAQFAISRLTDADELDLSDILEGFRCRVAEIFD